MKKQDIYRQCYRIVEASWLAYYEKKDIEALIGFLKQNINSYIDILDMHFGVPIPYELERTYLEHVDKKMAFYEYAWEYEKAYRAVAIDIGGAIGVSNVIRAFFEHGDRAANGIVASIVAIAEAYEAYDNHAVLWRTRAADLGDVESMKWLAAFYSRPGSNDDDKADEWKCRIEGYYNNLS